MKLTIGYDQVESPCDWDCTWKLVSFSNRHMNYEDPYTYLKEVDEAGDAIAANIGIARKLDVGTAFMLSCYQHGPGSTQWSIKGEGMQCRWDTAQVAGILLWTSSPKDMGAKTYKDRAADARAFLVTYNQWCNGECYYYCLETDNGELVDSCSGFIGAEAVVEAIKEALGDNPGELTEVVGDAACLAEHYDIALCEINSGV